MNHDAPNTSDAGTERRPEALTSIGDDAAPLALASPQCPLPDAQCLLRPPERFYWSVLDMPGYKRAGPLPAGMLSDLADDLPVPVESVHAVAVPLVGGKLLVCAAPRSELEGIDERALTLGPSSLPAGIDTDVDVAVLNLLVGEFEPGALRRKRTRRYLLTAAALVILSALLTVGLARRESRWRRVAEQAMVAADRLVRDSTPAGTTLALEQELVRLRLSATAAGAIRPTADAAARLEQLLRAWPASVPSKPQSLAVGAQAVTVSVSIEGDPSAFLTAFKPPPGWTRDEPRLNTAGSITRLTLTFKPPPTTTATTTSTSNTTSSSNTGAGGLSTAALTPPAGGTTP